MIWLLAAIAFSIWRYLATDMENAFTTELPSDLEVYLLGGEKVARHQPLYSGDLLPGLPFTYPPFAGVIFSWFEASEALGVAWKIASLVVLVWVVYVSSSSKQPVLLLAIFFAVCTEPIHGTLYFGQINIFLMGLVCLDFLPRNRLPGIGTGLAAGLKLTPAYFLLLFAVQRRWGAMFVAAFTFLCTVALGFSEVVDAKQFWTESIFDSARVGTDDNPGAQALRQALYRLGIDSTPLWLAACAFVTVLVAYAAHIAYRRSSVPLALAFVGMGSCLVSPFSWFHHWVWIVPFGVWVYTELGAVTFLLLMLPYAAVNVSDGVFVLPDALFTLVPVGFMLWYVWKYAARSSVQRVTS